MDHQEYDRMKTQVFDGIDVFNAPLDLTVHHEGCLALPHHEAVVTRFVMHLHFLAPKVIVLVELRRGDVHNVAHGGTTVLLASLLDNGLNYAFGIMIACVLGPSDF